MDWLKSNINKIANLDSLIEIYESCQKEEYSEDDCEGCILHELHGEWQQEEIDQFLNKSFITQKETVCFLIVHKDDVDSKPVHGLDKIKQLILPLKAVLETR